MTGQNKKEKKKKHHRINNILIVILLLTMLGTIGAFSYNLYRIHHSDSGKGETVKQEAAENEYSNDLYSIGNNPTDVNKKYFKELNQALKNPDDTAGIAQSVVKCFVTEYYTWTNKDGNYDIGGMQYIYKPKQSDFEKYTLNHFYSDMDLYLSQIGRDQLFQVKDVTVNSATTAADYTVQTQEAQTSGDENTEAGAVPTQTLPCVDADVTWTYEDNSHIDVSQLQNHAVFHVVNDNGRWEIAGIDA